MSATHLNIGAPPIEVALHRHARARRITLRLSADGRARVTVPPRMSDCEARRFVEAHEGWLRDKLARRPVCRRPAPGGTQIFRGAEWPVKSDRVPRAIIGGETILLPQGARPGPATARLLKFEAGQTLTEVCECLAQQLGLSFRRIRLADPKTRWGSCSSDGTLMFSWRLIMAPPDVLDYVAAHEVAHLREMNHSAAFWTLVRTLCPEFETHRRWLKQNGAALLAWDFT